MKRIVSVVGMAGAGKSEVTAVFARNGFTRIRFGDITDHEVRKRGMDLNEENERLVRELLRREYGMEAYARLNLPRIETAREESDVIIDGLYSWEEYLLLREHCGPVFCVVAVWASPATRHTRLGFRVERGLTPEEAVSRDKEEIEYINKGGPIAMADFTILNEGSLDELQKGVEAVIARLKEVE